MTVKMFRTVAGAVLALAIAAPVFTAAHPAAAAQKQAGKGQRGAGGPRRVMAILEKLNLTADQKTKIKDAGAAYRAEAEKLKGLSDEERKTKNRELGKGFRDKLNSILTEDQKKQLQEEMKKARPAQAKKPKNP